MDEDTLVANIIATTKPLDKTYFKTFTSRKPRKPKKRKIKRIKNVRCNHSNSA